MQGKEGKGERTHRRVWESGCGEGGWEQRKRGGKEGDSDREWVRRRGKKRRKQG